MFERLKLAAAETGIVRIRIDDSEVTCRSGDSVAAALLMRPGTSACRESLVSGAPRAPYCLMGVCYECMVTIDSMPNVQACMTKVRDGMRVQTQMGPRLVEVQS